MYETGHLHAHLDSIGVTTVRAGPGIFHSIVVNRRGSNNSRVVIRDDTNVIANLTTGNTASVGEVLYDAFFHVNLTVERIGGTAPDLTVLFK